MAEEVVTSLLVVSQVKGNGTNVASRKGVVMLPMGLKIGAKCNYAMFVISKLHTCNDLTGTEGGWYFTN